MTRTVEARFGMLIGPRVERLRPASVEQLALYLREVAGEKRKYSSILVRPDTLYASEVGTAWSWSDDRQGREVPDGLVAATISGGPDVPDPFYPVPEQAPSSKDQHAEEAHRLLAGATVPRWWTLNGHGEANGYAPSGVDVNNVLLRAQLHFHIAERPWSYDH